MSGWIINKDDDDFLQFFKLDGVDLDLITYKFDGYSTWTLFIHHYENIRNIIPKKLLDDYFNDEYYTDKDVEELETQSFVDIICDNWEAMSIETDVCDDWSQFPFKDLGLIEINKLVDFDVVYEYGEIVHIYDYRDWLLSEYDFSNACAVDLLDSIVDYCQHHCHGDSQSTFFQLIGPMLDHQDRMDYNELDIMFQEELLWEI